MSSYAKQADLAVLGLPAAALTNIDAGEQQQALDVASTLADGYLASKFTLPITTPSIDLTEAVCKIAAYNLMSVRGYNPETGSDSNIRDRYLDALRWLEGISKGTITPPLVDSQPGSDGGPFVLQPQASSDGLSATGGTPIQRGW